MKSRNILFQLAWTVVLCQGCALFSTGPVDLPVPKPDRQIWIAPNRGIEPLFETGAPWDTAKKRVHVFKFYVDAIGDFPPDVVPRAVEVLRREGIALSVEAGGLRDFLCDGEAMAELELRKMEPIFEAGGTLDYLALDSPFGNALATGRKGNCGFTPERTARELVRYIQTVRARHPDVRIGLIEPIPWYVVGGYPTSNRHIRWGNLLQILDLFLETLAESGETLEFFHADSPYEFNEQLRWSDGWKKIRLVQTFLEKRGVRFGLIYNSGEGGDTSDELFFEKTMDALDEYGRVGGNPDDFVIQSWYRHPENTLPEDEPFSFTYLVLRFTDRIGGAAIPAAPDPDPGRPIP